MQLDDVDVRLLALLHEDARLSFRDLAAKLGVTTPTISQRVKDLEDLGLLTGYRAVIDPRLLGGTLHLATVRARPASVPDVTKALAATPGVEEVLVLSGGAVHARFRAKPPNAPLAGLHAALAALPDVSSYELSEVLDVAHRAQAAPLALAEGKLDVMCHECKGPIHAEPVRARIGERAHVFCCKRCLADFRERYAKADAGR